MMDPYQASNPPVWWPDPARPPRRVVVGMSGGVDSTFAAWALAGAGAEVIGIHFKLGDFGLGDGPPRCCSVEDARDARRMADLIGIPFYVVNAAAEFRREVIEPFLAAYTAGRTPNPCVVCNPRIKWRLLLRKARELGADAIASGHHARVLRDAATGRVNLLAGTERTKDQSYFLARLEPEQLAAAVMPAGFFAKTQIRRMLAAAGAPMADKAESQDVCFVSAGGYAERIAAELGARTPPPGPIVDRDGRVLGRHAGIHRYTVGQRRGLGLATAVPCYVLALDAADNTVVAGPAEGLYSTEARIDDLHWLGPAPAPGEACAVRVRYKSRPAVARVWVEGDAARLTFRRPQRAITPGQTAVLYHGRQVRGCGTFVAGGAP
jgi:tRNA-uridine 2-sulfurtransferase